MGAESHERPTYVYPATLKAVIREVIPGDMKAHVDPSGPRVSFIYCCLPKHVLFQYLDPSILAITFWIKLAVLQIICNKTGSRQCTRTVWYIC